jgi:hypothetical protein
MKEKKRPAGGILFVLIAIFSLLAGCSGGSSSLSESPSEISSITEISSASKNMTAASGGTVVHDEVTAVFPAGILPADASIKVSKVSVSGDEDSEDNDPSLLDMTNAYVISTTSAAKTFELAGPANIAFKINPAGFDETSIRLVVWDGYEWEEIPTNYDETLKVVSAAIEAILPFGTRIYLANPQISSTKKREGGEQIVSEFVAMKVVGELFETGGGQAKSSVSAGKAIVQGAAVKPGRTVFIVSPKGKFTVSYVQAADSAAAGALKAQADKVAGYMDNAYETIVKGMGLKQPGKTTKANYGKTWPVELEEMDGVYGTADAGTNSIGIAITGNTGDGLSHTCHHEFTHLIQFQTLEDAGISIEDSLDWFGETMADAIGYYVLKGIGAIYCLAGESMGYFFVRLDADNSSIGKDNNDDYEYRHFPFISYLLAVYEDAEFKKFFETWYSYTPGITEISMATIDKAALNGFGKVISGRNGIFWDFYQDYFISGVVFNKEKFGNLPDRNSGSPYDIKEDEQEKQGVTIVEINSQLPYQQEFTIQRLSGQVAILRYKGSSETPMQVTVKVSSVPGKAGGRIQLVSFKRAEGVLQAPGHIEEVSDGGVKTKEYAGVGNDIHEIYLVMANTSWNADDYKVSVAVTEKQ